MSGLPFSEEAILSDPTWATASQISHQIVPVQSHVSGLFRSAWSGMALPREFVRVMSFSKLNPSCLLNAAGNQEAIPVEDAALLEQSITYLGARFSALVLAVNYTGRMILKQKPGASWRKNFQELITTMEVGYLFGGRAAGVGAEAGALIAFAGQVGNLILMVAKPKEYTKYLVRLKSNKRIARSETVEFFGCEPYQVAAVTLQQLGFGTDISMGVAVGVGNLKPEHIEIGSDASLWAATYFWIDSLRAGRNYPSDPQIRSFFPELAPPRKGERNMNLEVLYTEVARVKNNGSEWTWHLPKRTYDESSEAMGLGV